MGVIIQTFFEISIGLRQEQTTSPYRFALFLEYLELHLKNGNNCGLNS